MITLLLPLTGQDFPLQPCSQLSNVKSFLRANFLTFHSPEYLLQDLLLALPRNLLIFTSTAGLLWRHLFPICSPHPQPWGPLSCHHSAAFSKTTLPFHQTLRQEKANEIFWFLPGDSPQHRTWYTCAANLTTRTFAFSITASAAQLTIQNARQCRGKKEYSSKISCNQGYSFSYHNHFPWTYCHLSQLFIYHPVRKKSLWTFEFWKN